MSENKKLYSLSDLADNAKLIMEYDKLSKKYDDLKKKIVPELESHDLNCLVKLVDCTSWFDNRRISNWYQGSFNGYICGYRSLKKDMEGYLHLSEIYAGDVQSKQAKKLAQDISMLFYYFHNEYVENHNLHEKISILEHAEDLRVKELRLKVKELESQPPLEVTQIHYLHESDPITRESPEYRQFVKEVLARDNDTCQCCGTHEDLNVHHIYAFNQHNSLGATVSNGITLCESCHKQYHHEYSWKELCNPETLDIFLKRGHYSDLYVEKLENKILALKEENITLRDIQCEKESELLVCEEIDSMIQEYDKLYANSSPFSSALSGAFEEVAE